MTEMEYENRAEALPDYYERLGAPSTSPSFLDQWRMRRVAREVIGESVLDVGCYRGDFLELLRGRFRLFGADVNEATRRVAQKRLGDAAQIVVDFRRGRLRTFDDDSIDTVVCMEVLEHVADDRAALGELLRVARRRVIVTVPYRERLREHLCTHCGRPTPNYGHLRVYDERTFPRYLEALPAAPRGLRQERIGSRRLVRVARLTGGRWLNGLDRALSRALPDTCAWLMAVMDF